MSLIRHLTVLVSTLNLLSSFPLMADPSVLTLDNALDRAFSWSCELKKREIDIAIKEAEKRQAGRLPNPNFQFEVKDFGGNGQYAGWRSGELSYFITQLVETGGKRASRVYMAKTEKSIEYWNYEIEKNNLQHDVLDAYIDVAFAQEKFKVSRDQMNLANENLNCHLRMASHGKTNDIEQKRASIAHSRCQISLSKAKIALDAAIRKLVQLWGMQVADFDEVSYPFYETSYYPDLEELKPLIYSHPEYLKQEAKVVNAKALVNLEKANAVPDVALTAGYKSKRGPNRHAFEVDVSMPIPIFNQNSDNISRAKLYSYEAEFCEQNVAFQLESKLEQAYAGMISALHEVETIKKDILPASYHSYHLSQKGYEEGKFERVEMLEAFKVVSEAEEQYLEALANFHHLKVDVEELIGYSED